MGMKLTTPRRIDSADNPLFKQLRQLTESSHARRKSRVCLLDGVHLVGTCLQQEGKALRELIVRESAQADPEIAALLAQAKRPAVILADALFRQLAATTTPQGVLALVDVPVGELPDATHPMVVILDGIQDPGNAGVIIRAAAAAGATHVLFSLDSVFAWSPRVIRASQGAHFAIHVVEDVDVHAWLDQYPERVPVALMPRAAESIFTVALPPSLAWVVGNEGQGVTKAMAARSQAVAIPMPGAIESLNAAQALTIALFESVRRRLAAGR
jgi:RNA methyltransferase, TrmH family